MVWCALAYAAIASAFSWMVGRPLINLNAQHYAREADFRYALVRVNEQIDAITLSSGEADEKNRIDGVFRTVLEISWRIVNAMTRLTFVTAGYGWFTIIAPILVAAPAYFRSGMSFGELMMIVGAFNQVQGALRWFVDNFSSIADWRATLLRVASFRQKILTMDELGKDASRITLEEADGPSVKIDDLRVSSPAGCIKLSEAAYRAANRTTHAHNWRKWRGKILVVSRGRRPLALGKRTDHSPASSIHHVPAGSRLHAGWHAPRVGGLSAPRFAIPRRRHRESARRCRVGAPQGRAGY